MVVYRFGAGSNVLAVCPISDTRRMMQLPRFFLAPALWRTLVIVWAGVLWWLSSQSSLPQPASFEGVDKLEHTAYFAAGGACFLLGLRLAGLVKRTFDAVAVTVLFCAIVGGIDEWHQTHTPGRSGGDVADWLADSVGGIIGAFAALAVQRWFGRDKTPV